MGKKELTKTSIDADNKRRNHPPRLFHPALAKFFVQLPHKIQDDKFISISSNNSILMKSKISPAQLKADLKNQLQAWKENLTWVDQPPEIKEVISRRVLVDDGLRQAVDVEQAAIWKFLFWSGTIAVHVIVDQNRMYHSMKFKLVNTQFMKRFEGHWRVEPLFIDQHICSRQTPSSLEEYRSCTGGKGRVGSTVRLEQLIQPAVIPPPPISWYLRGITTRTTEMLITDLREEVSRIREDFSDAFKPDSKIKAESQEDDVFYEIDQMYDIKERWSMRRRVMKLRKRRLLR